MHQVKLFKGVETEVNVLERELNAWLAENAQVRVVNIFGNISPQTIGPDAIKGGTGRSFAPSDLLMVVVYEKV
jgi:hypothetical protein